ncbi:MULTISPECIES: LysR family transcriptional regulator [unclassified Methylophilus]|uniref:LysR family transcriptional regulator n=1 Tax=unclassified Methylophilus TaxID=2630143 RepID=UPI0006F434D2|nr:MULTISPECIES: LysR family transcriptional regulator [unclassified Methylophilus]KQT41365.1 transcriptional regulator [Methylophilus sp. Leaf416]KQT57886.1 transcriptional regulator [Methylophilus sp. Leaf459]
MDRFDTMLAFTRVVELESFTKAAMSLNLPKTTVSAQVLALEKRLRVKLLHRTTRRISVTTDGAAYYERAIRLLNELEETEAALHQATSNPKGRLRVDVPTPLGRLVIIPALQDFLKRYPEIQLEIGCDDRPIDLLEEGVDCVIRVGHPLDSTLVARRVGTMQFLLVASPEYLQTYGRPTHHDDLQRHQAVHFFSSKTGKVRNFILEHAGEEQEVPTNRKLAINNGDAIVAAALAGIGVCQVPTFMVQGYLNEGKLERVLGDYPTGSLPLNALYPQNRHLSTKVRTFIEWVAELFAECRLLQSQPKLNEKI